MSKTDDPYEIPEEGFYDEDDEEFDDDWEDEEIASKI